jgi:glucose/arabinose dehydrogenase
VEDAEYREVAYNRDMRRILILLTVLGSCLVVTPHAPATSSVVADPVASGLDFPAAFTFAPDGRIFYGERFTGEIRIFNPETSSNTLFAALPNVATAGEQGLLGLALHPNYPDKPLVFAFYTSNATGSAQNLIVRLRDVGGTGSGRRTIHTLPAGSNHNGGVIRFGPDKKLYAVVGDVGNTANSQNLSSDAGKVLRMTFAGKPAPGNPFATSRVYSYGHRNMFGFDFDPVTGGPWVSENGPACNDEMNRIVAGGNFGWGPSQTCSTPPAAPANTNQDGPSPIMPAVFYGPPMIAPTGVAFCSGCGLGSDTEGRLLFGAWNDGIIRRLTLTANRLAVASQNVLLDHTSGVLAVETGPDGAVYFSDSDQIFRLTL